MSKRIVVALGGNALQKNGEASASAQELIVNKTAKKLISLIKKSYQIVIVHGNGPQVGDILLHEELSSTMDNPAMPVDSCVAMSQGLIGYWLQQAIDNGLKDCGIKNSVASIITQVVVDKKDEAFKNPTKPIGPFYKTEEEAMSIARVDKFIVKRDSDKGWRRVIASPKPVDIVEKPVIEDLVNNGYVVITNGGGGIPVYRDNDGLFHGVEAVIDKDYSAAFLADMINADLLLILTNIGGVMVHYGQYDQTLLKTVSCEEIEDYINNGEFAIGSMLPKVQAAINFVRKKRGFRKAIITSLDGNINIGESQQGTIVI
jgi:carbamate kinase